MFPRKFFSLILIVTLLVIGSALLAGGAHLRPETAVRQAALSSMTAPAGVVPGESGDSRAAASAVVQPTASAPLRDLPEGEYFPQSDWYRLWLDGKIDTEFDGIPAAMRPILLEEAMGLPVAVRPPAQGPGPALGVGWDSIDSLQCCGGGTLNPPDPEMAAGPNHVIAVVNVALEIYDKNGVSLVGPTTLATFFGPLGGPCVSFPFDPNVLYDESADRFIIGADGDGVNYCVGVSQTADPTGAYWLYAFPADIGGAFFDYPHAGVGRDALYMGGNLFGSGQGYVYAMDKSAMYTGAPAAIVSRILSGGFHTTPQPANLHGWLQGTWPTTGPHYIFAASGFSNPNDYHLYSWDDPFGANVLTLENTFNLPAIHGVPVGNPIQSLQQGGPSITANDPRPLDFDYRNGTAWTGMSVSCNPGGGTVNCIQWAQIDLANAAVLQTDVFASTGEYRYFPDLAADSCGNGMVGYTRSSSSTWPSVYLAGPLTAGSTPAEALAKAGETTHYTYANRWGDYSGMTIDPDGVTFWYLGEYSPNNGHPTVNWGNYIQSATLTCLPYAFEMSGDMSASGLGGDTINYTVTLTNTGTLTDTYTLALSGQTWPTMISAGSLGLDAGDTGSVMVSVTIPAGAMGGDMDTVTVTATSTGDPALSETANLSTSVDTLYGLAMSGDMSAQGLPGETISYTVQLTNTGNTTDTYGLALSGQSWNTTLSAAGVMLAMGASGSVDVTVDIPGGALPGDMDTVTVTATSNGNAGVSESADLTSSVPSGYGVELSGDMSATGAPGATISYTVQITNTGGTTDTFDLTLSGESWSTMLSAADVTLAAGASDTFSAQVEIPTGALAGDMDTATVTATSTGDANVSDAADLTTSADAVYGVDMSGDMSAAGMPGETISYTVQITNTGNTTDTFALALSGESWPTSLSTGTIMLAAGQSGSVVVMVTVPAGTGPGDMDMVELTATSAGDAGASAAADLTTSSTGLPLYIPIVLKQP